MISSTLKKAFSAAIITALLFSILGCSDSNADSPDEARFETLERFKMFEDDVRKHGRIIRDKYSGKCYYWFSRGSDKSIMVTECPANKGKGEGSGYTGTW